MTDTIEAAADRKSTKAGLTGLKLAELKDVASSLGITGTAKMRKDDLVAAISARRSGGSASTSSRAGRSGGYARAEAPAASTPTSDSSSHVAGSTAGSGSGAESGVQQSASADPASGGASGRARAGSRRVRNLATAFARAMPIANTTDPVWETLPLGNAGTLEVQVDVDGEGKIVSAKPTDPAQRPNHLTRLVERTVILLRSGRFALRGMSTEEGSETFLLEARIEQIELTPSDDPSQAGPYALGFSPPRKSEPGYATFTLRSGRRIHISISLKEP